jgi:hypothetical protein
MVEWYQKWPYHRTLVCNSISRLKRHRSCNKACKFLNPIIMNTLRVFSIESGEYISHANYFTYKHF